MAKRTAKTIELPAIKLGVMRVTIRGTSDLIVHAWGKKAAELADKEQHKATEARGAKDPQADFEECKHKDEQGRDCTLAAALKKAIVATARVDDSKKMTEIRQSVFVRGEKIPLAYQECVMREDIVRLKNGSPTMRYRPMYKGWSATFEIEWLANVLSVEQVLHMIQLAGFSVGLHEWRPERNGEFGRFALESVEALSIPTPDETKDETTAKTANGATTKKSNGATTPAQAVTS